MDLIGKKAVICQEMGSGNSFFRFYNEDGTFIDAYNRHYDLEIEICDPSATLIEKDGKFYIDYTKEAVDVY